MKKINIVIYCFFATYNILNAETESNLVANSVILYAFLIGIFTLLLCYGISNLLIKRKDSLQEIKKSQDSVTKEREDLKTKEKITFKLKLKEYENLHESIINQTGDGIFIGDTFGNFLEVNPAGEKISGYSRDELLKMNLGELFTDTELKQNPLRYDLLDINKSIVKERNLTTKSGKIIPIEMNSTTLFNGNLLTNMRDLTHRKEKEKIIADSEHKLRTIFNAMDQLIMELDDKGKYINIAPTVPNLLYKDQNELLGKSLIDILPDDVAEKIMVSIKKTLKFRVKQIINYELNIKNELLVFKATFVPKSTNTVILVAENITEQKKLANSLENYQKSLEKLVKERTRELEEKNKELSRLNDIFTGREYRIKELKDRIIELETKRGE